MKIDGRIIITLVDLRRFFNVRKDEEFVSNLKRFWGNRRQFVRDFAPENTFYWDEKDKEAYRQFKELTDSGWDETTVDRLRFPLSRFTGRPVSCDHLADVLKLNAFKDEIIQVKAGDNLYLRGIPMTEEEAMAFSRETGKTERLHKIEIDMNDEGDDMPASSIYIGEQLVHTLKFPDCVYVTEIDGKFRRALEPSYKSDRLTVKIQNIPGSFSSNLKVVRYNFGAREKIVEGVTHFTVEAGMPKCFHTDAFLEASDSPDVERNPDILSHQPN